MHPPIVPVILAGGSGERLWPLSKRDFPKQFVQLDGSGRSLFQQTLVRVADRHAFSPPIIVCNEAHRFIVTEQLEGAVAEIIIEPQARNTAPALLLAALHVPKDALLLVLPSDHRITDVVAFHEAVSQGAAAAKDGWFVTFAVTPTSPETGYGYIKLGEALAGFSNVRQLVQFTEKPDRARAEQYLAKGGYGWNSGMFLLRADAVLDAFSTLEPTMLAACRAAYAGHMRDLDFIRPDAASMQACPSISIDYALMEKTDRGAVIPVSMGWSDLGSWNALHAIGAKDQANNHLLGEVTLTDSRNCHVHAVDGRVTAIGLEDMLVVSANEMLFVAPRARADEIKLLLQQLHVEQGADMHRTRIEHRPWGRFEQIDHGAYYRVKKLWLNPGAKISLQKHGQRAEHWVVVEGRATVTNEERRYILERNQSTFIPAGAVHRLENHEQTPLLVIEIQTGELLDEADITRFEDAYNRG